MCQKRPKNGRLELLQLAEWRGRRRNARHRDERAASDLRGGFYFINGVFLEKSGDHC